MGGITGSSTKKDEIKIPSKDKLEKIELIDLKKIDGFELPKRPGTGPKVG